MKRRLVAALFACSLTLAACTAEQISIATISTDAGGGKSCKANDDCAPNELCAKTACANITGGCQLRPLLCDGTQAPSCGCNGVTYWNDCLRKQQGDPFGSQGECLVNRTPCQSAADCPAGGSCARLVENPMQCAPNLTGSCWWLPGTCPAPQSAAQNWEQCGPMGPCRNTCSAIRDGRPHHAQGPICP